jgi:hypothetical protein
MNASFWPWPTKCSGDLVVFRPGTGPTSGRFTDRRYVCALRSMTEFPSIYQRGAWSQHAQALSR